MFMHFLSIPIKVKCQAINFVHFTFENQAVMKFFLAIFAVLAVANAQESCDLCKMGVDALGQYLMTGKKSW